MREREGEKETRRRERIIVRDERMKFTELHIAVVTFHPCKIYFPLSRSFCRMHFFAGYAKDWEERKERERNRMRGNMIDRENERIHETRN